LVRYEIAIDGATRSWRRRCGGRAPGRSSQSPSFRSVLACWRLRLLLLLRHAPAACQACFCLIEYLGARFRVFRLLRRLDQPRCLLNVLSVGHRRSPSNGSAAEIAVSGCQATKLTPWRSTECHSVSHAAPTNLANLLMITGKKITSSEVDSAVRKMVAKTNIV
jgi:hypothetical protein